MPLSPVRGEGALAEIDLVDVVEDDLGLEALGVLQKALHQVRALHAVHVSGPVIHFGGGHQLSALRHAGDQHGVQVGARSVNGGGVARGARAEDQNFRVLGDGHGTKPVLCAPRQGGWALLENKKRARQVSAEGRHTGTGRFQSW